MAQQRDDEHSGNQGNNDNADNANNSANNSAPGGVFSSARRGLMQGAGLGAALSLLGAAGGAGGLISSAQAAEAAFPRTRNGRSCS